MIKLGISGAQGRMGQRIIYYATQDKEFAFNSFFEYSGHPKANEKINNIKISTNIDTVKGCDVLIDFTTPEATMASIKACVKNNVKMVIGTTGLLPEQIEEIKKAAKKIAIVYSSNMSLGVNLLFKLTQLAGAKTKSDYAINIVEAHHIHKKDAPSGTAKTLAQIAEAASGVKIPEIKSIREGEIVGDHTIVFESAEDVITISHHAKTRDIFAKGAVVAARFIAKKDKGLFNMQQVLGLE